MGLHVEVSLRWFMKCEAGGVGLMCSMGEFVVLASGSATDIVPLKSYKMLMNSISTSPHRSLLALLPVLMTCVCLLLP